MRVQNLTLCLGLVAVFVVTAGDGIADGDSEHHIMLRTDVVDTRTRASITRLMRNAPAVTRERGGHVSGAMQVLVRVRDERCSKHALQALLKGGRVLYHVSRCAFVVMATGREEAVALDAEAAWVGPMLAHYKIAPEVVEAGTCRLRVLLEPPLCGTLTLTTTEDCRVTPHEWASQQASRWVKEMQLVGAEAESERCVIVECQDDDMTRVAKLLAEQEQVHWVDRYMPIRTRAFHAAHNSRETELRVDVSAVWARGINGSGEVVHVADSGVDVGHCLFHDPNVAVPYNRVDMLHRKVCIDIYIYIYIYTSVSNKNGVDFRVEFH